MIKFKDYLIFKEDIPTLSENLNLIRTFTSVDNAVSLFRKELALVFDTTREMIFRESIQRIYMKLKQNLDSLNEEFREKLLKKNKRNKKWSLYCLSLNGVELEKIIGEESNLNWKYTWQKNCPFYDKRSKPPFTPDKMIRIFDYGFNMLYQKYNQDGKIYYFQFQAQLYKMLIEFFEISLTNNYYDLEKLEEEILHSIFIPKPIKKILKKIRRRNYPSIEEYMIYRSNGESNSTIQKNIAEQLGVSTRAVRDDMAKKGLTNKKYIRKDYRTDLENK